MRGEVMKGENEEETKEWKEDNERVGMEERL
jgi:hypothetical protein